MIFIIIITIITIYYYLISNYNYWKSKNVPGPCPSLIFGNTKSSTLLKETIGECLNKIYRMYSELPYVGIYELRTPVILIQHPKLIKLILVKDSSHFHGRGIVMNESADPLCANLINLSGARWRMLRSKLTPAFTSGKIKQMFHLMAESSNKFNKFVDKYAEYEDTIEFRDLAAKFTTEVISTCCFGLETNSIQNNDSEFRSMCRKVLDPSLMISLKRMIRWYLPGLFQFCGMSLTPTEVSDYFLSVVKNMIEYREHSKIIRHDMMHLLMQLKRGEKLNDDENDEENHEITSDTNENTSNQKYPEIVMDDKTIAAQAYIFFLAGFETSSTTISFAMHELAANPIIQDKLYSEINNTLNNYGGVCYDAINNMEYLDRVIRETLRKHPPVEVVPRVCNKKYLIPGTNLIIDEGIKVLIPIRAIHHDPKYYPNPMEFNPDRFFDENKKLRENCTFLPFGDGPRICIGTRFAYTQIKLGLVALLKDYQVFLSSKTTEPLEYDPTANILTSKSGIWLKICRRK